MKRNVLRSAFALGFAVALVTTTAVALEKADPPKKTVVQPLGALHGAAYWLTPQIADDVRPSRKFPPARPINGIENQSASGKSSAGEEVSSPRSSGGNVKGGAALVPMRSGGGGRTSTLRGGLQSELDRVAGQLFR